MARITIKDVAEQAGFSINTVSRALNDQPAINPETRDKILTVAHDLGYRPNKMAQALRSQKTKTIGIVVTDIANPFFSRLVKAIGAQARDNDYSIILADTDEDLDKEREAIQLMLAEQVDGLLLTPVQTSAETVEALLADAFPFVLLGRHFLDLETPFVDSDDVRGGGLAAAHLIDQGCERVAIINGPAHISSARHRLLGYRRALEDHGRAPLPGHVLEHAITMQDGYRLALRLFESGPTRPDGVFVYSDLVALGAMQAARELGLRIPEDVALVGYDDIEFSSFLDIPLTTVRIPKAELGKQALSILQQLMQGETPAPAQVKLDVELVVRRTSVRSKR